MEKEHLSTVRVETDTKGNLEKMKGMVMVV